VPLSPVSSTVDVRIEFLQLAQNGDTIELRRLVVEQHQVVKPHGDSQMPVWGDAFSKTTNDSDEASIKGRIAALVTYLESIQERPAQ
jgi:hypothetical protein